MESIVDASVDNNAEPCKIRARINFAVSSCSQPGLINAVDADIYIGNISWYYAPGFITGCKLVFFLLSAVQSSDFSDRHPCTGRLHTAQ